MRYIVDLDGTLCENIPNDGGDVYSVKPYLERIEKLNKLYDEGNMIIIDTARGSQTGFDHHKQTGKQLKNWGIKYHILRTGTKFFGDKYIDDKGISDIDFFK